MRSDKCLGDIAEIVMGQSPSGDTCNEAGNGIPLLNGPTEFGSKHPHPVQFTTDAKKVSCQGDLLFCVRGSTTGRMNWANQQYAIGRGLAAIRGKNGYPNSFVRAVIEANLPNLLIQATGSTFPNVSRDLISSLPIPSVTPESATEIASIVEPIDDRIALLRETNTTLEAIAQALFKSWFVDFDPVHAKMQGRTPEGMDEATAALFPDSFEDSELGPVPKGWSTIFFRDSINVIGGGTPKTSVPEYWGGDIPWFSVVDAPSASDVFVVNTEKHITEAGLNGSSTKLLPAGTTIISARGTVGRLALTGCPMAMNQSCYGLRGKAGDQYFTYFSTTRLVEQLKQRAHGSVFDTITQETFAGVSLCYPATEVMQAFEQLVEPLLMRIRENLIQANSLASLRDALLPRLISGQLLLTTAEEKVNA